MVKQLNPVLILAALLVLGGISGLWFTPAPSNPLPTATPPPIRSQTNPDKQLWHSIHYYHKKSFFEQHGKSAPIVMIGDSLTEGADWQDLFPNHNIANRGIGSDRTDGILERLDSILSTQARKAFVMVGINDFSMGVSVEQVFANYRQLITTLQQHGLRLYIQSTVLASGRHQYLNPQIQALNHQLKSWVSQHKHLTYIDLNTRLAPRQILETAYTFDGIHLNGDGYAVWRDLIRPHLDSP